MFSLGSDWNANVFSKSIVKFDEKKDSNKEIYQMNVMMNPEDIQAKMSLASSQLPDQNIPEDSYRDVDFDDLLLENHDSADEIRKQILLGDHDEEDKIELQPKLVQGTSITSDKDYIETFMVPSGMSQVAGVG